MVQQGHGMNTMTVSGHASMVRASRAIPYHTVTLDVGMTVLDMAVPVKATWITMEPLQKVRAPDTMLGVLRRRHKSGTRWKVVIMNAH